jgi:RHS repeat-associated protein
MVGSVNYELLSNHLGNVLSTISDKKVGVSAGGVTVDYYNAEVLGQNDYYAFGSLMPGRKYSVANTNYRYGYQGFEKDNEVAGEGNSYTAEFWQYESRLGRRWNVDPMAAQAQSWSPYRAFYDNPIFWTDPTGAIEFKNYDAYKDYQTKNKGEILGAEKMGGQGHWLTSDRTGNTSVWDAANTFNINTNNQNQYAPYEQVRDFYSWVNKKSSSMGHEVKWMKGALGLVSALASHLEGGSIFVDNEVEELLSNLNIGIQNSTMSYFNDLLFGKYRNKPLKGADAQEWDETLVKYEQGEIAPPIYAAASKTAITKLNNMANASFGTWHGFMGFVGGTTPHFNWFGAKITSDQARIDVPLLMMYPSTYKPKWNGFKDKVNTIGTLNARWLNIFQAYQVK